MHFIETLLKEPLPPLFPAQGGGSGEHPNPGVYTLVYISSTPGLTQSRAHKPTATHSRQRAEWHSHPGTSLPVGPYRRSPAFWGLSTQQRLKTEDLTPGPPAPPQTCVVYFFMSLEARLHPSFPLQLQPSLIFLYLTSSSCLHQTYRLFFKASPKLLSFTPVSTLIALFSVKLTSNWSPCFCPSYSDLKQPFETNNQLSPCLQTDVHAQHEPAGRRLTRGYSRQGAVIPRHPSSAAFIAATQTEPLSPNPHSLRVSGRRSGFLPPPTMRLVPQLSSPSKTLHLLDIFNELHLTLFTCLISRFPWRRRPWVPRLRDPSLRWAPSTAPGAHADQSAV